MRLLPFVMVILLAFFTSGLVVDYLSERFTDAKVVGMKVVAQRKRVKRTKDYSLIWKVLDARVDEGRTLRNITGGELLLVGISVGEENRAIIKDTVTGNVRVVKRGDRVGDLRVLRIQRDRVIFEKGKERLYLTFVYSKGGSASRTSGRHALSTVRDEGNNRYAISRSFLFSHFSNVSRLLREVNVAPYFHGKEVKGYVIRWLSRTSALRRMGLRTGDIVREINGIPLRQPQDIFNIMKSAMSSDVIRVRITRGSRDVVLEYDVR